MNKAERIEAAAKALEPERCVLVGDLTNEALVQRVLDAAYPELASGTHVLAPREPTEEMLVAMDGAQVLTNRADWDFVGDYELHRAQWLDAISAYERSKPESE